MFIYIDSGVYNRRSGYTDQDFTEKDIGKIFEADISLNNGLIGKRKLRVESVDVYQDKVYASAQNDQ
jgi:hypothetical protein